MNDEIPLDLTSIDVLPGGDHFEAKVREHIAKSLIRDEAERRMADSLAREHAESWRGTLASEVEPAAPAHPEVCVFDGTRGAFYRGKINWLYGDNDSAKTWLTYYAAVERLKRGEAAIVVDYEMGVKEAVARLRNLGASREELSRCRIVCPNVGVTDAAREQLAGAVADAGDDVGLLVIDSAGASMSKGGLDSNRATDVEEWVTDLARWACRQWPTAAVVVIDHTPHEGKRATGSKRKGDTADAVFRMERGRRISIGEFGYSTVRCEKDRQGVHPYDLLFCFEGGGGRDWATRLPLDGEAKSTKQGSEGQRTRALAVVNALPSGQTIAYTRLREQVGGNSSKLRGVIAELVKDGLVVEDDDGRYGSPGPGFQ